MKKMFFLFLAMILPVLTIEARIDPDNLNPSRITPTDSTSNGHDENNNSNSNNNETPSNKDEVSLFTEQLEAQIKHQQEKLDRLMQRIQDKKQVPSSMLTLEFQVTYEMLEVKRILFANFVGTPSVQFPEVRKKLLGIMKKDLITMADLAELNALVKRLNA